MRNLVKTYSYIAGSRTITLDVENDFTIEDIRLVYNETQKVLLCATANKDLVASIVDKSITFVNTLPVLVAGDKITIDVDFDPVATETLINEMNVDRSIICQAVRDKGQNVENTDPAVTVASKIRAISSEINVQATPGIPSDWHDLTEAIGSVNDVLNPYKYALLIPKGVTRVYLQGGIRFDMSDGVSTTSTGIYNFDTTKDELPAVKAFYEGKMAWMSNVVRIESVSFGGVGNVNLTVHVGETINEAITLHNLNAQSDKQIALISGSGESSPTSGDSVIAINGGYQGNVGRSTRWIVFSSSSPNPVHSFGVSIGDPAFSWVRKVFQVYIYNVSIQGLNFDGCYIPSIIFDDSYRLTNGADDPANNTFKFIQQAYQFRNNFLFEFKFPPFSSLILDSEKELNLNQINLFGGCNISNMKFPDSIKSIIFSSNAMLNTCNNILELNFPDTITNFSINSGLGTMTSLATIKLPPATNINFLAGFSSPSLIEFIIPVGVKNITFVNSQTFNAMTGLERFIFPNGMDSIDLYSNLGFNGCVSLNYFYISNPSMFFRTGSTWFGPTQAIKFELESGFRYSINFSAANMSAVDMETYIIDRLLDLRSTAQENVFVKIEVGALTAWNAVLSDGSALVGHANFQEIFRVGQVVIVNIGGTNRSYIIADIPTNNQMVITNSSSMVAGTYELNYNKIATFGATNLAKLSVAQKAKATTKEWQLA